MSDVSVRPARASDVPQVVEVQLRTWRTAYDGVVPREALEQLTEPDALARWHAAVTAPPDPRHHLLVALEGDRVVGLAASGPATDDDLEPGRDAELLVLLVDPEAHREGHGSRLLAATVDTLRTDEFSSLVAWLFDADAVLQSFLELAGWARDGARRELDMGGPVPQQRLHTALG